jgi:hypothetical protein
MCQPEGWTMPVQECPLCRVLPLLVTVPGIVFDGRGTRTQRNPWGPGRSPRSRRLRDRPEKRVEFRGRVSVRNSSCTPPLPMHFRRPRSGTSTTSWGHGAWAGLGRPITLTGEPLRDRGQSSAMATSTGLPRCWWCGAAEVQNPRGDTRKPIPLAAGWIEDASEHSLNGRFKHPVILN